MKRAYLLLLILCFVASCSESDKESRFPGISKNLADTTAGNFFNLENTPFGKGQPLDFASLTMYLPKNIDEYTAGEAADISGSMNNIVISGASKTFVRPGKDGYEDYVTLKLFDFIAAAEYLPDINKDDKKSDDGSGFRKNVYQLKEYNVWVFEEYDRSSRTAYITATAFNRFLIEIECNSQVTFEFIRKVLMEFPFSELLNA
jgi:hypothetical protein